MAKKMDVKWKLGLCMGRILEGLKEIGIFSVSRNPYSLLYMHIYICVYIYIYV